MSYINVESGFLTTTLTLGLEHPVSLLLVAKGKLMLVNSGRELHLLDDQAGPEKKMLDGVLNAFVSLGEEKVILKTWDGKMLVWNWKRESVVMEFGGLDGRDVVDVAWDKDMKLAVFFMGKERFWIAYELSALWL